MGMIMGKEIEIEDRGRILIPKELREEFHLRPKQRLIIEKRGKEIILKPSINKNKFVFELKGCVKKPKMKPMEIKKIWEKL